MATTRDLFNKCNLRCTTQRLALYEALRQRNDHPTAEELYRVVKGRTNRVSLATVYNTLEALCRAGLARKLPTSNGRCRYDGDTSQHMHILVRENDAIEDIPYELADRMMAHLRRCVIDEIERELGIEIDGISVQLLVRRPAATPV